MSLLMVGYHAKLGDSNVACVQRTEVCHPQVTLHTWVHVRYATHPGYF